MNRPLIIGLIGGVIGVVAIALTFLMDREPADPPVAALPPVVKVPPSVIGVAKPEPGTEAKGVAAPAAVTNPVRPSFDLVRVNPEGDAVLAGRAEPNSEVTLKEGAKEIGKVKADSRGEWVLVPKKPLPAGSRELSLWAKIGAGPAKQSDKNVVVVVPERGKDIAGRQAAMPAGSLALLVPREGSGATTVLQKPSTETSAVPSGDAGGVAKGGPAPPPSLASATPAREPPPAKQTPPAKQSDKNVVVVVPERGKDIAGRHAAKPAGSLALLVPREGSGATAVLQKPSTETSAVPSGDAGGVAKGGPAPSPSLASATPAKQTTAAPKSAATKPSALKAAVPAKPLIKLALDAIDYDDAGKLSLSGTAPPEAGIRVYLDNRELGTAGVGDDGRWKVEPRKKVPVGLYTVRIDQVAEGGRVVSRVETKFSRAGPLGDLPHDAVIFVQPGNSLWRIARRSYGSGVRYSVIYEANKEQIRDPSLIYPGQVFLLPRVN